jgi:L-ascorbate metabolism protein UlaG (beta-lactamase superfamily)
VLDVPQVVSFALERDGPSMLKSSSVEEKGNGTMATLTWLGHASFRLDTDSGKRIYVDPWVSGPTCPASEQAPERADVIAVTHGHGDHAGDVVDLQKKLGCKVIGMVELMAWLSRNGLSDDDLVPFNKGGSVEIDGVRFTMTHAFHSSSAPDGTYAGEPAGFVVQSGGTSIYFAGDTCVFGDMQLIARLYGPQVAVLPIGDHYTMGPEEAALALELLGNPRCVPCHWGTFPALTGTPDALAQLTKSQVDRIEPGDTVEL